MRTREERRGLRLRAGETPCRRLARGVVGDHTTAPPRHCVPGPRRGGAVVRRSLGPLDKLHRENIFPGGSSRSNIISLLKTSSDRTVEGDFSRAHKWTSSMDGYGRNYTALAFSCNESSRYYFLHRRSRGTVCVWAAGGLVDQPGWYRPPHRRTRMAEHRPFPRLVDRCDFLELATFYSERASVVRRDWPRLSRFVLRICTLVEERSVRWYVGGGKNIDVRWWRKCTIVGWEFIFDTVHSAADLHGRLHKNDHAAKMYGGGKLVHKPSVEGPSGATRGHFRTESWFIPGISRNCGYVHSLVHLQGVAVTKEETRLFATP